MICLVGNLPVLQVGHHQVVGYSTEWIDEALHRAAARCDRNDFPFIDEIRDGVLHYLEHRCPLRVLSIEDLYKRIEGMLHKIGCDAIAYQLKPLAPPVTVSLARWAREAGNGYELVFFCLLTEDLNHLADCGAEVISFRDIQESAMILRGKKSFTKDCAKLALEMVDFIENFRTDHTMTERQIELRVESKETKNL
ncbi:hypothetical protein OAG53_00395 [Akkermansiaceae bacterium]|nr:hypothetical protein [Akkermansiaceae bacterium]